MKQLYTLIAILATISIFAQAPQGFNYQATVRNSSGALIVNQNVYFKFNLMLNSPTALPVYSETHYVPTDDLGQVNLTIGTGTASTGSFSAINWGAGNYYLGIELNTGNAYVAMGTTQLLSVPFALYANSAGNGAGVVPDLTAVLAKNNSANGSKISALADPTDTQDAATKAYVDSKTSSSFNFNGFDNNQVWQDNTTLNLVPNSFYFINANNTTLVFPGQTQHSFGDVIYVYVMQSKVNLRNIILKYNGFPLAFSAADNSLVSSFSSTTQFVGNLASGLNTIVNVGDFWMCANFTGTATLTVPTLTTSAVSSVTLNPTNFGGGGAVTGGSISDNGGSAITSKGVVVSSTQNPTLLSSTYIVDGAEIGAFSCSVSNLAPATTYYLRAFATNAIGTTYGNQITVQIPGISFPIVMTTVPTNITTTNMTTGGTVTMNGGAAVTARGICWCLCTQPTISDSHTTDGSGEGVYTSSLANLPAGADVYVRAYATNSQGTAYGAVIFAPTLSALVLGQTFQGGKVAYVYQAGDSGYVAGETHGIIAAPEDQSTGIRWNNGSNTTTGATKPHLGNGMPMTDIIVSKQGPGDYAAQLCADLVLNTYSDWYLPSQEDLIRLYLNRDAIGGFIPKIYWSSTEYGVSGATTCCAFSRLFTATPFQDGTEKSGSLRVRAVRYF